MRISTSQEPTAAQTLFFKIKNSGVWGYPPRLSALAKALGLFVLALCVYLPNSSNATKIK